MIEVGKKYRVIESPTGYSSDYVGDIITIHSNGDDGILCNENAFVYRANWLEPIIEDQPQSAVDTDDQFQAGFEQPKHTTNPKELTGEEIADVVTNNVKKIRRFESGAVRSDDTGRLRPDFISPYALAEIAKHFTGAKNDFGATNYYLGIKPKDIFPSITRHWLDLNIARVEGNKQLEREEYASIAANCIMALHQIVLEERGLYKEVYDSVELVDAKEYLKSL